MNTETKQDQEIRIPESITINGVTYSVSGTPELKELIASVAKVEKSKLYTQIEALRKQIEGLKDVEVVPSSAPLDVEKLVDTLSQRFVTKDEIGTTVKDAVAQVVQPILKTDAEKRKQELEEYRDKLIQENLSTCIPEMVKGNSKEEIESSLKESIRIRASYPSPNTPYVDPSQTVVDPLIKKQEQDQVAQANSPTQNQAPTYPDSHVSPIPRRQSPDSSITVQPKRMSQEEFARNREALKEQLSTMYGQG